MTKYEKTRTPPHARAGGKTGPVPPSPARRRFDAGKPVCERRGRNLEAFSIPTQLPAEVRAAIDRLPQGVEPDRHPRRKDLRRLPLVTIDGATARDFDDAVFAEPRGNGWRLVVAIADVAHYVEAGQALDQEAWRRGTSVYLPDRVIPSCPRRWRIIFCSCAR